jgi:chondroitin 4-sulfotransferase 11
MTNGLNPYAGGWTFPRLDSQRLRWGTDYPHYTAREIRFYLGRRRFNRYFKFAFVRNPWDRLVSRYYYLRAQNSNNPGARINERDYYPPGTLSFSDWLLGTGPKRNCIHPLDLRQQLEWLTDTDGTMLIDYVGRYETLSTDYDKICGHIGIDTKLPHLNTQSPDSDYRKHYTSETVEFVSKQFREDIQQWNYEF